MMRKPQNSIILARISDARDEDTHGVDAQVADGRALADRLGWRVGPDASHVLVENDVSAFKRKRISLPGGGTALRTVRPAFRQALAMLASGEADGLLALDLDRTARDPRDLEDLIDVVEASHPRVPVESVTGSLRLASDGDITMARVLTAVANKSSRDTARRVADARQRNAADGKFGGGRRPFGFERDGVTVRQAEAAEIAAAADAVLAGVSLREVTAGLRQREVPTVTGARWQTSTVRDMLLSARIAGLKTYKGQETGPAEWPAIIPEPQWRGVCAILQDPARRTSPKRTSPAPRHLLSLIARCGVCHEYVTVSGGRKNAPTYCCSGRTSHLRRVARQTEAFVSAAIVARLSQPDAADLLQRPGPAVDTPALQREASAARARLDQLGRAFGAGVIDFRQLEEGSAAARADAERAERALATAAVPAGGPLADIAGHADAAQIWAGLDIGRRRAIVRLLADVTIRPAGRGGRLADGTYFDPAGIEITWRVHQDAADLLADEGLMPTFEARRA